MNDMSGVAGRVTDRFFIDGGRVRPSSSRTLEVVSPVTEEPILRYPQGTAADMDRAVSAARAAFDEGPRPRMARAERAACLRRVAARIAERLDEIAGARTRRVGAPIALTKTRVPQNATLLRRYADLIATDPLLDRRSRDDGGQGRVPREPVGVCAAISPWNAPMVLLSCTIAAGPAAGCCMVAKPSPETPIAADIMAGHPDVVQPLREPGYAPRRMWTENFDRFAALFRNGGAE